MARQIDSCAAFDAAYAPYPGRENFERQLEHIRK
jgi:hypothetical protein